MVQKNESEKYLGKKCKDRVTGFEGTCTGYVIYLTGCHQVLLTPSIDKDGKTQDQYWVDKQRVEIFEEKAIELDNSETPGPDQAPPTY